MSQIPEKIFKNSTLKKPTIGVPASSMYNNISYNLKCLYANCTLKLSYTLLKKPRKDNENNSYNQDNAESCILNLVDLIPFLVLLTYKTVFVLHLVIIIFYILSKRLHPLNNFSEKRTSHTPNTVLF